MKKHDKNTCPECGKEIASKISFSKHLASHLSSQTAICSLCGLKVLTKLLQAHQKSHEDQQSYTCSVCHFVCTQKQMLARHLKSVHGLEKMPIEAAPPMVDITQETDDSLWNLW
jgi:hypothetical protein